jgi:hypothetical protein
MDLICANRPQAKGLIQRANGILQNRLIKEMRLENVFVYWEKQCFFKKGIFRSIMPKFAKTPLCSEDAHRTLKADLDAIFF